MVNKARLRYFPDCIWYLPPDQNEVSHDTYAASAIDFLITVDKKFHSVLRIRRPDGLLELFVSNAKNIKTAKDLYKQTMPMVAGESLDKSYFNGYRYLFGKLGE